MAWIELHDTLPDHPKTLAASEALKIDKDHLVGKLCRLWTWCLNHRENGFIADYEMATVAEVMRWGKKPDILFKALCTPPPGFAHGFLDRAEGGYIVHDWDERVGMIREKREEKRAQTRERVRKYREGKRTAGDEYGNADLIGIGERGNADISGCNALHARYETHESNASNAATVPKPYLNHTVPSNEENEDTKSVSRARARGDCVGLPIDPAGSRRAPTKHSASTVRESDECDTSMIQKPLNPESFNLNPEPHFLNPVTRAVAQGEGEDEQDDQGSSTRETKPPSLTDRRFDTFWSFYPKKVGKLAARKAFEKIKMTDELHKRILKAIILQKKTDQWLRDSGRYIPNPATWLNRGEWDNEIPEEVSGYAADRNDARSSAGIKLRSGSEDALAGFHRG